MARPGGFAGVTGWVRSVRHPVVDLAAGGGQGEIPRMRSPVLLAGCGFLLAGCAVSTASAPAPGPGTGAAVPLPATLSVSPSATLPATPGETVIEDPACPPARQVVRLARVSRVEGTPRCAEGWAAATGVTGGTQVRVLLRRDGFDFVVAQVGPVSRPCPAALPATLRTAAGCP